MKNFYISVLLLSLSFNFLNAQRAEKVKGNRNVTVQQTFLNSFHSIIADENFKIDIIFNKEPYVEIETDDNLHEFINFNVRDSVLTFNMTRRVTSKKKMNITVNYDNHLKNIETKDSGEIFSLATLELENVTLKTSGNSKAGITIETNFLNLEGLDKSKIKLNLTSDSTSVNLRGNSKLEALVYSPKLIFELNQRSDAIIDGESENFTLKTDNYSRFSGKDFATKTCNLIGLFSSDITLGVIDSLDLSLSGASNLYLYENPKIEIIEFSDTSKIQKRIK